MKIGKFEIIDSFKITGRGLVAKGNILEGKVKIGSFTTIRINSENFDLQIKGVDFIDGINKDFWTGLMFTYKNESESKLLENVKPEKQIIDIYDQR